MSLPRPLPLLLVAAISAGTWAVPTPEAEAATGYQKQLLRLHNKEREKRNRTPLRFKGSLNRASVRYAGLMSKQPGNFLSHTGPDGSTFDQRIRDAGGRDFTTMGENIAFGQRTPKEVTAAWIRSPGHRRNILNPRFRFVGFGRAGSAPHWVTNFGG